jgi:hypothetical protein
MLQLVIHSSHLSHQMSSKSDPSRADGDRHHSEQTSKRRVRSTRIHISEVFQMGRGILLWLLGIPLPIVILLVLFMR